MYKLLKTRALTVCMCSLFAMGCLTGCSSSPDQSSSGSGKAATPSDAVETKTDSSRPKIAPMDMKKQ